MKWPKERQAEFETLRNGGASYQSIAELAGVSVQLVKYHLKSKSGLVTPDYAEERLHIPEVPCALTADWHIPYYSKMWLDRLLAVRKALNLNHLAIVGDLMDFKWLSKYPVKDRRGGLALDFEVALNLLDLLLEEFTDVWWVYGNHEDRLQVTLRGHDILPSIFNHSASLHTGNLHLSAQRSMMLGTNWQLEHPQAFSRDGCRVAKEICAQEQRNVATGHSHHFGFEYDVSGKFVGVDLGGMFAEEAQDYMYNNGGTTFPKWVNGFWVYMGGGVVRPFADAFVDWGEFDTTHS